MSGILAGIGKVFRRVVKTVKKFALPALAIGAVVLTGGAALGILPALGAGGLGLSAGLTAVVAGAGYGGMMGAATAAITGKPILKGLTSGALIGGATGGFAQALGAMPNLPGMVGKGASTAISGAAPAGTLPLSSGTVQSLVAGAAKEAAGAAVAPVASGGFGSVLGGVGKVLSQPIVAGSLITGIGAGITGSSEAKAQLNAAEKYAARKAANYGTSGFFQSGAGGFSSALSPAGPTAQPTYAVSLQTPDQRWRPQTPQRSIWRIDPVSGQPYQEIA